MMRAVGAQKTIVQLTAELGNLVSAATSAYEAATRGGRRPAPEEISYALEATRCCLRGVAEVRASISLETLTGEDHASARKLLAYLPSIESVYSRHERVLRRYAIR